MSRVLVSALCLLLVLGPAGFGLAISEGTCRCPELCPPDQAAHQVSGKAQGCGCGHPQPCGFRPAPTARSDSALAPAPPHVERQASSGLTISQASLDAAGRIFVPLVSESAGLDSYGPLFLRHLALLC